MNHFIQAFSPRLLAFFALATLIFAIGCEEDPVTPTATSPTIELVDEAGFVANDTTLNQGDTLRVKLNIIAGTNVLSSLTFLENGTDIAADRVTFGGFPLNANPTPIPAAGEYEVSIVLPDLANVTYDYAFIAADDDGLSDEVRVSVATDSVILATPVIELTGKLLLNAGGMAGQGGIDLLTGESTGSRFSNQAPNDTSYLRADLKDEGIDTNLPAAQNWKQMISEINDSDLRIPDPSTDFTTVTTKEDILAAWALGVDASASNKVELGDTFLIYSEQDDTYFIINTTNIVVTPNNNNDYYEFTIKY